jgi:DNA polymerase
VFKTHGKVYEATATQMFKVPIESVTKGSSLRQRGKLAQLSCGYGGSVGALKNMGALERGIDEDDLPELVQSWRRANPHIVRLWYDVERAALDAVSGKTAVRTHGITFTCTKSFLFVTLPSGRKLAYFRPEIGENRFGSDSVTYEGINSVTHQWERIETFGGRLTENLVQGTARDLLQHAMFMLRAAGYRIVGHVHDEVILEVPMDWTVENALGPMCKVPDWFKGFPLNADGYCCEFYRKDG